MKEVLELFEDNMLLKHNFPKFYSMTDDDYSKMWSLYDAGFVYPLVERTENGHRVLLVQTRRMDPKVHTAADAVRLISWIGQVLLEEEETQIAGIATIVDLNETTFAHLRLFSISDVLDMVSVIRTSVVGRQKGIHFIALPKFAVSIVELAKRGLSEKVRKKITFFDDMEGLKASLDLTALLPSEHGGTISESEMMQRFKDDSKLHEERIFEIQNGVDWDRVALDGENPSCAVM